MYALWQRAGSRRGLNLVEFDRGRARRQRTRWLCQRLSCELLENRSLLATTANSIENLTGLAISAVQNVSTTQDVATFQSADSAAVTADFTATINWGTAPLRRPAPLQRIALGFFTSAGPTITLGAGRSRPSSRLRTPTAPSTRRARSTRRTWSRASPATPRSRTRT